MENGQAYYGRSFDEMVQRENDYLLYAEANRLRLDTGEVTAQELRAEKVFF